MSIQRRKTRVVRSIKTLSLTTGDGHDTVETVMVGDKVLGTLRFADSGDGWRAVETVLPDGTSTVSNVGSRDPRFIPSHLSTARSALVAAFKDAA